MSDRPPSGPPLPRAVQKIRARIIQTARGGDIDDLKVPLGWNEVPPLFRRDQPAGFDPIDYLRRRSFDGRGHEMLRILDAVFTAPFARSVRGPVVSYLWPVFPAVPTPSQTIHRWQCVRFADLGLESADGAPPMHRAAIGEDGTWHYFWTEPKG